MLLPLVLSFSSSSLGRASFASSWERTHVRALVGDFPFAAEPYGHGMLRDSVRKVIQWDNRAPGLWTDALCQNVPRWERV